MAALTGTLLARIMLISSNRRLVLDIYRNFPDRGEDEVCDAGENWQMGWQISSHLPSCGCSVITWLTRRLDCRSAPNACRSTFEVAFVVSDGNFSSRC